MISLHWSGHSWNEAPSVSCFLTLGKVSPRKIVSTALKIAKNTQLLIDQPSLKLTPGMSSVYKMPWRQTFQLCSWEFPLSYSASWVRPNTEPHGWGWVHLFTLLDFIALETPTRVDNSVKVLPGFLPQSLGGRACSPSYVKLEFWGLPFFRQTWSRAFSPAHRTVKV